jgi:CRP-like cAMP-binding protein
MALYESITPRQNQIVAALPSMDLERLLYELELVPLIVGEVIYETSSRQEYLYFPISGIVSLLYILKDGASAEIAVAGNEAVIGIAVFTGGETMPNRAVVQSTGYAYRLHETVARREFSADGLLHGQLMRYMQALLTQVAQTAVCNRHHSLEQQLCRWLLLSLDRLPSSELTMTHELIANMLGVHRGGVTEAAGRLQAAELIQYTRGHINILDRAGLEARACECYSIVRGEYDRLLCQRDAALALA